MITRKMEGDSMLFYENGSLILTVEETETENGILMALKGQLKSETAHHIQDELDAFTVVGVKVVLDFQDVTFASAAVLNALLDVQQRIDQFRQGEMVLRNVSDSIYRDMDETGIAELLMIEE